MVFRLCKIALVASVAFFLLLVVFNNLTDYGSNYAFVSHVLAMDTTFPNNGGLWRAIHAAPAHHVSYAIIIAWEVASLVLCAFGAWRLWQTRRASAREFARAKALAVLGLTTSLLQWFVAFITIGGEWFLMWQSRTWNGQEAAFRMFACLGIVLLYLSGRDDELSES